MSRRAACVVGVVLAAAGAAVLWAQFAEEDPQRPGSPFLVKLDVPRTVRDSVGTVVTLATRSSRAAKDFVTVQGHRVSFELGKGRRPTVCRRLRQEIAQQIEAAGGRVADTDSAPDAFCVDYWFTDQALFGTVHAWLVDAEDGRVTLILLVQEAAYEPQWLKDRQASRRP
jgi:hypothetical protein